MSKAFAYSWSVLESFETCPRRHYLLKVAKEVVEPESDEMRWGKRLHRGLELALLNQAPLPESMIAYQPLVARVQQTAVGGVLKAETKLALNTSFEPCSWFAKDCHVRVVTDFTVEKGQRLFLGDWKTGKPKPKSGQLRLGAAVAMHQWPDVDVVFNAFVWLATGKTTTEIVRREDVSAIWQDFEPRAHRIEQAIAENKWPAKPSGLCRKWCPVGKMRCEHCGG